MPPQAPNPGAAPFQQTNQGLTAARQGGGGPSPVAALVAATQKPAARTQRRSPQPGPRADFSGIQQAGSSIGNALRTKYQREFDEKMAKQAHENVLEQQKNLSDLNEQAINKNVLAKEKHKYNESQHTVIKTRLQIEGDAYAAARAVRNGKQGATMEGFPQFSHLPDASTKLFQQGYTQNKWKQLQLRQELPDMKQAMVDDFADSLGVDRGPRLTIMENQELSADAQSPRLKPFSKELERTDLIHGDRGNGFSPLQRAAGDMSAELGAHSMINNFLSEIEMINLHLKEMTNEENRQQQAKRFFIMNEHIRLDLDHKEAKQFGYLDGFGVKFDKDGSPDLQGIQRHKPNIPDMKRHMLKEAKQLIRQNFTGDTFFGRDNATGDLDINDMAKMAKDMFPGAAQGSVASLIDLIVRTPQNMDSQLYKRLGDALVPKGNSDLGQWDPSLMSAVHLIATTMVDTLDSIDPGSVGPPDADGNMPASTASNWGTAFGFDTLEEHEVQILANQRDELGDFWQRIANASNHGGGMSVAIDRRGAALFLHRNEHATILNNETQGSLVDDIISVWNQDMPNYIDADQETFERIGGQYFGALGGLPARQHGQVPSVSEPPFAGQEIQPEQAAPIPSTPPQPQQTVPQPPVYSSNFRPPVP